MKIPFSPPDISELEINEVIDTLKSGWITTGPKTKLLEKQISEYCRTNKTACLNSATACMELTLRLLGIGTGDEVITTAYTYSASASVICHVGAIPVLVDTEQDSFFIDYNAVEQAITNKTKAIIPVDIAGVMCDYQKLLEIVGRKKELFLPRNELQTKMGRVALIADAAHSFGARANNNSSGSVADFTSFSFHAVKNFTTAEGGAVTWKDIDEVDNDYIYKQFMLMSLHGQDKDALAKSKVGAWEYDIVAPYYKCNMTDIMAALGIAQMKRYPAILQRRQELITIYNNILSSEKVEILEHSGETFTSSGHLYMLRLLSKDSNYRNFVIEKMAEYGIATNVHYKPLPLLTAYKNIGFDINDFPNSYARYENEITLPLYSTMSDDEAEYVAKSLRKILNH